MLFFIDGGEDETESIITVVTVGKLGWGASIPFVTVVVLRELSIHLTVLDNYVAALAAVDADTLSDVNAHNGRCTCIPNFVIAGIVHLRKKSSNPTSDATPTELPW